jgi:hypothetical protein
VERRPAANRRSDGAFSYYFPTEPNYTVFVGSFVNTYTANAPIRKARRPTAKQFFIRSDTLFDKSRANPLFYQTTGGPSGESYLRSFTGIDWQNTDSLNSVGPLRAGPIGLTSEADMRLSRPNLSWSYSINGSIDIIAPGVTSFYTALFNLTALSSGDYQITTGTGIAGSEQTTVTVSKPLDWLGAWARIALVFTGQHVKLFVGGEQVGIHAIPAPLADIPSNSFARFRINAAIGDNETSNVYVDSAGLVFNEGALYSANYTPSPLRY